MNSNDETALTTTATDGFTSRQIDLIRRQIAPDASADELALFLEVCRGTGLNPFLRQIHAVFRNTNVNGRWEKKMAIQTGIDGYRLLAARTGSLAGIDDAVFDTEDADHPNKASVTVWRFVQGQRVPFTATARWREYVQTTKDGNPTSMWAKMPFLMLQKCCEALALRKAFPAELSGVYTAEEMMQADNSLPEPPRAPQHRATPPEPANTSTESSDIVDATPAPSQKQATQATGAYNPLADTPLRKRLTALGIRTVDDVEAFAADAQARFGRMPHREACYAQATYLESPPAEDVRDAPDAADLSALPTGGIRP